MVTSKNRTRYLIGALGFVTALFASALPASLVQDVNRKFELIERDRAVPGAHIPLTAAELTAYAREQAGVIAPHAVSNANLTIGQGTAEAMANINFLKMPQVAGQSPNWLMRQLLDGERPVRVRVSIQSKGGQARVDVQRVEISGIAAEGKTLEFLMKQFVIPSFKNAEVGRWFRLDHNIDRLDLKPGTVDVWIAKSPRT